MKKLISIGLSVALLVMPFTSHAQEDVVEEQPGGRVVVLLNGNQAPFTGLLIDKAGIREIAKIQTAFDDCADKNAQLIEMIKQHEKEDEITHANALKKGLVIGVVGTALLAITISIVTGGK